MLAFEKYSMDELLKLFNRDFYKNVTSVNELLRYLSALSFKVCEEAGERYPQYKIVDFKNNDVAGKHIYKVANSGGKLVFTNNAIVLNLQYLNKFEHFKKTDNLYYIYTLIDTVLHETRHYIQYGQKQNVDPLVKAFTHCGVLLPKKALERVAYIMQPVEIDARYYSYQAIKRFDSMKKYWQNIGRKSEIKGLGMASSLASMIKESKEQNLTDLSQTSLKSMEESYNKVTQRKGMVDFEDVFYISKADIEKIGQMLSVDEKSEVIIKKVLHKFALNKLANLDREQIESMIRAERKDLISQGIIDKEVLKKITSIIINWYENEKVYKHIANNFYQSEDNSSLKLDAQDLKEQVDYLGIMLKG